MRINEFVEQMAVRFDSKLQTDAQIRAFRQDCIDDLKPFEGETLSHAYHQIKADAKSRTHPTIGQIRKICNEKMSDRHLETNARNPEYETWQKNKLAVQAFRQTDQFKWCAKQMIGNDALLHVQETGETPTRNWAEKMIAARNERMRFMNEMENDIDLSDMQLTLYKLGKAMDEKNRMFYEEV